MNKSEETTSLQTNTNTSFIGVEIHADRLDNDSTINIDSNLLPEEAEDTTISSASSSFSIIYGILSEIDKNCNYIKLKTTQTTEQTYYIQQSLFNPNSSINKSHQFITIVPLSLEHEYVAVFLDSSQKVIDVQRFIAKHTRDKFNIPLEPHKHSFPDKPAEPEPTKTDFVLFPTTLQPSYTKQHNNKFKYNPSFTGSTTLDKELYEYIQNHCDAFGTINPSSPEYPLILNEQSHTLDDILEHYILITQLKHYDDGTIKIHYVILGKLNKNINLSNYGFSYVELQKDPNRTFIKPVNPKKFLKSDSAFQHYLNIQNNTTTKYGFQKRFTYKYNNNPKTTHADIVIQPISGDYSIKNILDYIRNPENIANFESYSKLSFHEICSYGKNSFNQYKYESKAFIFPVNLPKNKLKSLQNPLLLDSKFTKFLYDYSKLSSAVYIYKYNIIGNNNAGILSFIRENQALLQDKFNQFLPDFPNFIKKYSSIEACSLLSFSDSKYIIISFANSDKSQSILPFEFIQLYSLYMHDQNQLNQFLSKLKKPVYYDFADSYIPSTQTILQLFRKSNFKTKTKKLDYEKLKQNPYEVYKQLKQSCSYIPVYHSFDFIKDTIPYREPLSDDEKLYYAIAQQNNISYDSAELYFDGFIFDEPIPGLYELTQQYQSEFLKFAQDKSNSQNQINNYFDHLTSKIKKYISDYEAQNPVEASRSLQNQFSLSTNIINHIQPENGLESLLEPLNAKSSNSLQTDFLSFSTRLTLISQIYKNSSYSSFSLISHKTNQICIKIHQNFQNYAIPYIDDS